MDFVGSDSKLSVAAAGSLASIKASMVDLFETDYFCKVKSFL